MEYAFSKSAMDSIDSGNAWYCQCVYVPKYFGYVINNFQCNKLQNKEF